MPQSSPNKKVASSLLAMSSAAVMAIYAAGYQRTRPAADRFMAQAAERRPAFPPQAAIAAIVTESRPAAPAAA